MKTMNRGYILLVTLLFIQVISLLVMSNQRLMIQSEKSLASYQRALQEDFNRYHLARWIAKSQLSIWAGCQFDVSIFNGIDITKLTQKSWCMASIDSQPYQFIIEKLHQNKCFLIDSKQQYIVTLYQLVLRKKNHHRLLLHVFYQLAQVDSCDDSLPFVIKRHLPSTWYTATQ